MSPRVLAILVALALLALSVGGGYKLLVAHAFTLSRWQKTLRFVAGFAAGIALFMLVGAFFYVPAEAPAVEAVGETAPEARSGIPTEKVDLIVSLPPQMPFSTEFNPWRHGGPDGTDVMAKIIRQARNILIKNRGRLYLVHAAIANPARVRETLQASGFKWEIVKTVEKTLDRGDLEQLAPGLMDYLLDLRQKGLAEIESRRGRYHYPVWFYRAVRL